MEVGVFLPISGRAASRKTLMQAAQETEALGYDSLWAADRIIIPWQIDTIYPYSKDARFIVPPDRPFFEPLTCLAFLAGCTEKIRLGMSVMVLPYRHPLYWAKIAATIDQLSTGRLILGVGVGWMEEEFAAMNGTLKDLIQNAFEWSELISRPGFSTFTPNMKERNDNHMLNNRKLAAKIDDHIFKADELLKKSLGLDLMKMFDE